MLFHELFLPIHSTVVHHEEPSVPFGGNIDVRVPILGWLGMLKKKKVLIDHIKAISVKITGPYWNIRAYNHHITNRSGQ